MTQQVLASRYLGVQRPCATFGATGVDVADALEQAGKPGDRARCRRRSMKRQGNREGRPTAGRALDGDITAHDLRQPLDDGKAKPGALPVWGN
jgi:hypothetical protein